MKRLTAALLCLLLLLPAAGGAESGRKLTSFYCSFGGEMRPEIREITLEGSEYWLREDWDAEPVPLDAAWAEALLRVIEECGLTAWDGFHGSDPWVLDGESFSLDFTLSDGTAVSASGENDFPPGYREASGRLREIFRGEKRSRLAGTYRYEGEGAGGDFLLTLAADGSYTFYEGPYSSYLGGGEWEEFYGALYLQENQGLDLQNVFAYDENTLYFAADSSDGFPYVKVPEMGRFRRTEGDE